MKKPTQCIFWHNPQLILRGAIDDHFERLDAYIHESHLWRYLLKCRECGQKYFFEFYEEIDWIDSQDPQYWTYIPVETDDEINQLKNTTTPLGLLGFFPRLQKDFPKGADKPTARWVRKE